MSNTCIRPEQPGDITGIAEVNRQAFGQGAEASLVDALRSSGEIRLSLVAVCNEQIVGHILFSRLLVETDNGIVEALALAPMAVLPCFQRRGIGSQLVQKGLDRCRELGHGIVAVLGNPEFYPRFGFSAKLAEPLSSPFGGGKAWMALELVPAALEGVKGRVVYPQAFMDL